MMSKMSKVSFLTDVLHVHDSLDDWPVGLFVYDSLNDSDVLHAVLRSRNNVFRLQLRLQLCKYRYLFAQLLSLKVDFSFFKGMNIDLIHLLYPIQYELPMIFIFYFSLTRSRSREPELKLHYIYRLQLRPKVSAPCGSGSTTLPSCL
jgi:hypothetical protein